MFFLGKNGRSGKQANGAAPDGMRSLHFRVPEPPGAPSDGSSPTSGQAAVELDYDLWRLGLIDGRLGQPMADNEKLLRAQVEVDRRHRLAEIEGRIAQMTKEIEKDEELLSYRWQSLERAESRLVKISEERLEKRQEYSLILGIIYFTVAIILMLSDIPLSLRLVAEGYDIPTQAVLDDGTKILIEQLFIHPGLVLQYLWEPLALAFGIAFSGIFVKIFIDEVIWNEAKSRRLKIFLYVVATVLLVTLISVGVYRAQRQAEEATSQSSFQPSFLNSVQSQAPATSTHSPFGWDWGFISFLLITLMLPSVGGICFLAGWLRIQNWSVFRECRSAVGKEEKRFESVKERLAARKGELEVFSHVASNLQNSSNASADLWCHLYRHGYWRGSAIPETAHNESLFERCDRLLVKDLLAQARSKFWNGLARSTTRP